ncbi:hypothetical protein Ssi02_27160 [Sinosporangium siamense]|uniref:Uncharacterized protein n=1 Tax=Sinosporangium siamense TaxID=1367973 RepID=A0A919REM5_9ACTN|nr:hypothetical protein Ssi02_27160 [Sinosporangium siamense]
MRKELLFAWRAGMASAMRKTAMAAMIASSVIPAAEVRRRNGPSPRERLKAGRCVSDPLWRVSMVAVIDS